MRNKEHRRETWYKKAVAIFIFSLMIIISVYFYIENKNQEDLNEADPLHNEEEEILVLITENPHINAVRLMHFLRDIYGQKILSGQHVDRDSFEMDAIYGITGKYPAIMGLDFMDYSPSRVERGASGIDTDKGIDWWNRGGIVDFCWHWNAPMDLIDKEPDQHWWSGMYTRATTFDFQKGLEDQSSEEYRLLLRDMDAIAEELKKLQDAGAPVLWRPLHEASGGWFWWGSKGPEPYKALWRLMFDRFTEHHELKNLIWVWNGQDSNWYPGDDVVDIIGEHAYLEPRDYSPLEVEFKKAQSYSDEFKMVALTENGPMPDPEYLMDNNVTWLWFCTWSETPVVNKERNKYSDEYTEIHMLKKVYHHEYVITKDELPELKNYPIK